MNRDSAVPHNPLEASRTESRLDITGSGAVPLDAMSAAIRSFALGNGVAAFRATRLRVVVEEMLLEAFARETVNGADNVSVIARADGNFVRVTISDRRLPVTAVTARHLPSRRLAALGFVDQLHIEQRGNQGNSAECCVQISPPEEHLHRIEVLPPDAPELDRELAEKVEIRAMRADDAVSLPRCVYRCYGYTYVDPSMYNVRHIRHAIESGAMHSVVAVLPDGEIVGHCAFVFEELTDRVPEAGKLIVDPRLRGHHLAERLGETRLEIVRSLGISGLWSECVTNHPASQALAVHLGGSEVGLMIGAFPPVAMTGFQRETPVHGCLMVTFTPAAGGSQRTVHLPNQHADHLQMLSARIGLQRTIVTSVTAPDVKHSAVHQSVHTPSSTAHLRIQHIGSDLQRNLVDQLETLLPFDLVTIFIDVPLDDPSAAWCIEQLESLHFSWAAWLPEFLPSGDVIRMQRSGSRPVDVDHIHCARPEGEAVRDHVVKLWRVARAK
jgi:RimJ/RimL family protein N-acetyltransferase